MTTKLYHKFWRRWRWPLILAACAVSYLSLITPDTFPTPELEYPTLAQPTNRTPEALENPVVAQPTNRTPSPHPATSMDTTVSTEVFRLAYNGFAGLGHRLMRMAAAYHLAKTLNLTQFTASWGSECGRNNVGDPDIFHHLFGRQDMTVIPSNEHLFSWLNTSRGVPLFYPNDTRKRYLLIGNEVPGYSHHLAMKWLKILTKNGFHGKQESDIEFYTQLQKRFRFKNKAMSFMKNHSFWNHTMIGLHVRAGNGEKGDFTHKRRGIDDLDRWVSNVAILLQQLQTTTTCIKNVTKEPLKIFLATDTPSVLGKLRSATRQMDIDVIIFEQNRVEEGKGVSFLKQVWEENAEKMCHQGWVDQFMDIVLLSHCDMVVAGRYSSFTQSMPLTMMTALSVNSNRPYFTDDQEEDRTCRAFCEIGEDGDMMECYSNYTEWIFRHRSSPIIGNHSSPRPRRSMEVKFPNEYAKQELKETFLGTVMEDYFF
eukprot:scaffold2335_cov175-Amphora_coffeaeformis.AAC.9